MAYNSGRESMRKRNLFIYYFKWEEPDPIPVTLPRTCLTECKRCLKTLTFEDRSRFFGIDLGFGTDLTIFTSIDQALRETGISICALRMLAKKQICQSQNEKRECKRIDFFGEVSVLVVAEFRFHVRNEIQCSR